MNRGQDRYEKREKHPSRVEIGSQGEKVSDFVASSAFA